MWRSVSSSCRPEAEIASAVEGTEGFLVQHLIKRSFHEIGWCWQHLVDLFEVVKDVESKLEPLEKLVAINLRFANGEQALPRCKRVFPELYHWLCFFAEERSWNDAKSGLPRWQLRRWSSKCYQRYGIVVFLAVFRPIACGLLRKKYSFLPFGDRLLIRGTHLWGSRLEIYGKFRWKRLRTRSFRHCWISGYN